MEEPDFAGPEEEETVPPVEQPPPVQTPPVETSQVVPAPTVGPSAALAAAEGAVVVGQADVAAAVAHGPAPVVVAPPPGLGGTPIEALPEEPKIPEPEVEHLPLETDSDAWLDLLRDGYLRQLREENEYAEPPPFHRAIHFAAEPGGPCPPGKYPKAALNLQLQMLLKNRIGGELMLGNLGKGNVVLPPGQKGGKGSAALAAVAPLLAQGGGLTDLIQQMQNGYVNGKPANMAAQGQLLIAAAKALAEAKAKGGCDKGKGKGKDKGKGKFKGYKPY